MGEIIEIQGLTKRYGEVVAVDDLTLSIHQGEVFGLLGPNGAGKTTTTLMLLGLTEPTAGCATISGFHCTRETIDVKRIVGYLPDSVGFYPDLTGRENLRFTGKLNGLSKDVCEERIDQLLERVGMTYAADRKAGTYSRGMRQRLGIADVLMKDPQVIIMDEPTLGIDPEGMRELIALIRELSVKDGRTILISSHQLHQIQQICDRVGIFVKGKLIACGPIEQLGKQLQNEGFYSLSVKTEPADEKCQELLAAMDGVTGVSKETDGSFKVESKTDVHRQILQRLMQEGYSIAQMRQEGGDLDEIYRRFFEKAGEQDEQKRQTGSSAEPFWKKYLPKRKS